MVLELLMSNPEITFISSVVVAVLLSYYTRRLSIEIPVPRINELVIAGAILTLGAGFYFFATAGFSGLVQNLAQGIFVGAAFVGLQKMVDGF